MKKAQEGLFSNTLASLSRSQERLKAGKETSLSPTKSQRISPDTFKNGVLPKRMKEAISNIPNIDNYRKQTKLTFTGERAIQINKRLEIDSIIEKNFDKRLKNAQFYIEDSNNPFTKWLEEPEKVQPLHPPPKPKVDIIEEIAKLRKSITLTEAKKKVQKDYSQLEAFMRLTKARASKSPQSRGQVMEQAVTFDWMTKFPAKKTVKHDLDQFDVILKIREESHFHQKLKQKPWNIFQLINNKNHEDFRSNKEILDKLHFNRDSIVSISVAQKKNFQSYCLQEISSFSRELILNPAKKWAVTPERLMTIVGDMRVDMEKLDFDDVMKVCSGRLTSLVLLKYLKEEDLSSKNPLENQEAVDDKATKLPLSYGANSMNRSDNFTEGTQDRTEIRFYGNTKMSEGEHEQQRISGRYKETYRRLLQEQCEFVNYSIKDRGLIRQMNDKKNRVLLKQLDGNVTGRFSHLMNEVDRKIRMNKISKDRTESIKIKTMTETLKLNKATETIRKGKSPLQQTWR